MPLSLRWCANAQCLPAATLVSLDYPACDLQAAQQHVQRLKQFQRQRRSSAAGAESVAAGTDARPGGVEAGDVASPAQQQQPAVQRRKRQLFPMQINLAADDVALRFEHHPLEVRSVAWVVHCTSCCCTSCSAALAACRAPSHACPAGTHYS